MKYIQGFVRESVKSIILLFFGGVVLMACEEKKVELEIKSLNIKTLTDIEGTYSCSGECITTSDGTRKVSLVLGETDNIRRYPGAKEDLYEVSITAKGFHELELGVLSGRTLRTATAEVSDSTYPVIEEYVFDTDDSGKVIGFTKSVRNPDPANFKTCVVYGKKINE